MNSLSPPTDNLYKFWAIGWLIAALFCASYPIYQTQRLEELNTMVSIEQIKSRVELIALMSKREAIEEELKRYKAGGDKIALDRMLAEQKIAEETWAASSEAIVQLQNLQRKTSPALNFVLTYTKTWIVALVVSFLMSMLGFCWWWKGFQKYQDMQLRAEARLAVLRLRTFRNEGRKFDRRPRR